MIIATDPSVEWNLFHIPITISFVLAKVVVSVNQIMLFSIVLQTIVLVVVFRSLVQAKQRSKIIPTENLTSTIPMKPAILLSIKVYENLKLMLT